MMNVGNQMYSGLYQNKSNVGFGNNVKPVVKKEAEKLPAWLKTVIYEIQTNREARMSQEAGLNGRLDVPKLMVNA